MKTKSCICVSLPTHPEDRTISTHGQGEHRRHHVALSCHAGVAQVKGRDVSLILNNEEMMDLVTRLLGNIPLSEFEDPANAEAVARLMKVFRVISSVH